MERCWEIIVGENGVLKTAYKTTNASYEQHLKKDGYFFLGTLKEVERYVNDEKSE